MDHPCNNIVVVDDDPLIRRLVGIYLAKEGFQVWSAGSGAELFRLLADGRQCDLVILDLMLPDMHGFEIARRLRATSYVPIIMLTGKTDPVDMVAGLEIGADDYVTKPFNERELVARIRAVLRRCDSLEVREEGGAEAAERVLCFAGWRLDVEARELLSPDGGQVHLTNQEFQLLALFTAQPNHVHSRERILEFIARREWTPYDRSADVLVGKLRKKLALDADPSGLIETVRGAGYKFTGQVERC